MTTPEQFIVRANRDGDMRLQCGNPDCHWDRNIDPDNYGEPGAIKGDDLGSLLEAARTHIAEAHRATIDGEVTP